MLPDSQEIVKVVSFKTARSSGKGGQNVNKVSSKVELIFCIADAYFFTEQEKSRLKAKLANRIDSQGLLHVVSQEDRSQLLNKQRCVLKLLAILKAGLHEDKVRKATQLPKAVKERRLMSKSKKSEKKESRRKPLF